MSEIEDTVNAARILDAIPPQVSVATSDGAATLEVRVDLSTGLQVQLWHGKELVASGDLAAREGAVLAWLMLRAEEYVKVLEQQIARRRRLRGY